VVDSRTNARDAWLTNARDAWLTLEPTCEDGPFGDSSLSTEEETGPQRQMTITLQRSNSSLLSLYFVSVPAEIWPEGEGNKS